MPENGGDMLRVSFVDRSGPAPGGTCIRVDVAFQEPRWCGIAVASAPDYAGLTPSDAAYDWSPATTLVFWARGAQGGEHIQVKVAIAGEAPYGDSARAPASTGWLDLSPEWKQYELAVGNLDLRRVVTPFAVITDESHNPSGSLTFFLDEIHFVLAAGADSGSE